jgi:calcium-dependent protein kinase
MGMKCFKSKKTNNILKKETMADKGLSNTRKITKVITSEHDIVIDRNLIVNKAYGNPNDFYTKIDKLGVGAFGVVWKVQHNQTGLERAMKKITKNPNSKKETQAEILNEIEILKKIDHPNIVKIFEFFNTPDGYFLITEFCGGGELYNEIKKLKRFKEETAGHIMFQLLSAVSYCHSYGIIHRDLKPENILIESKERDLYNIKVIDFGTAKILEKNKQEKKVIGSSYYIAPEVLEKNYNEKSDLWSCGVIMYILLCGKAPFTGETDNIILEKIKLGDFEMKDPVWSKISNEAKDLIKKLLEHCPKKRLSAQSALQHKWFKKFKIRAKLVDIDLEHLRRCIDNIKKYKPAHKLQQLAIAYLVHNIPQMEGVRKGNKIFNLLNEKSDCRLTRDEVNTSLHRYLGNIYKQTLADEIFEIIDIDQKGYIENEEFIRACIDKSELIGDEILKFAFAFFDKDKSGEITLEELKEVLCGKDKEVSEKLLKSILDEIDIDGNNQISFDEFKIMMGNILK